MQRVWTIVVVGVALVTLGACSSDDSPEPLSYDDAVQVLIGQGYTDEAARCLIDGTAQQKVDLPEFMVTGKSEENTQTVIDAVSTYCVQTFGGTSIPPTSAP